LSLKVVTNPVAGQDADHVGGQDWNKIANYLNGGTNALTPTINSDTKWIDSKCKFIGTSAPNVLSLRTSFVNRAISLQFPQPLADNNDDTLMTNNAPATVRNKTFDSSNNIDGTVPMPSARKWGMVMIGPDVGMQGQGLLSGYVHEPATPTFQVGATNGLNWRYSSGGSANTITGIRMTPSFGAFCCRDFHSLLRVKTRVLTGPTNTRQYIGFSTRNAHPGSDTALANAESGMIVGWRTSDAGSAVQVFRNSGAGAMSVTSTAIAPTTGVTQFEVGFYDADPEGRSANPGARVRILSARGTSVTYSQYFENNIPALGTMMYPSSIYSTTGTNTNYDFYTMELLQDQ